MKVVITILKKQKQGHMPVPLDESSSRSDDYHCMHWAKKHQTKEDPASATLAVQTIRNTILVAVFVGGNAVNIAISYANNYKDITDRNYSLYFILIDSQPGQS